MAHNFRTIDFWDPNSGIAKSIKSINLNDIKYSDPKRLENQLRSYLNSMKNFKGAAGFNKQGKTVVITEKSINKRRIEIAIPGKPTKEHQNIIDKIKIEGETSDVDFTTTVVK